MGHSHAIYNPTDKPVQWMNINVSMFGSEYENFDLNDKREDVARDKIPVFMTVTLDRSALRDVNSLHGGKGTAQYRRAPGPAVFVTPWAFADHIVLPARTSIGTHLYRGVAQFYHVMAGEGTVSLCARGQQETATSRIGDAIPIQFGEVHSIGDNRLQPLALIAAGVPRDTHKELEYVDAALDGRPPN